MCNVDKNERPFKMVNEHLPDFSTRDIRRNYVDSLTYGYMLKIAQENGARMKNVM